MNSIERVPLADSGIPKDSQTLSRLLSERFSCRAFLPQQVERPLIEQMLSIAQMSASWCNSQPWQVVVTEGIATDTFRDALHASVLDRAKSGAMAGEPDIAFPAAYQGVYKERQREVGWQLYSSVGIEQGDRVASARQGRENFRLFGAPHVLIITTERDLGTYGVLDCGLYMGTLMLAAQSLGLGLIAQAALAAHSPFIRSHFALPDHRQIIVGASFGYADPHHPANRFRSRRAPLDRAVEWRDK